MCAIDASVTTADVSVTAARRAYASVTEAAAMRAPEAAAMRAPDVAAPKPPAMGEAVAIGAANVSATEAADMGTPADMRTTKPASTAANVTTPAKMGTSVTTPAVAATPAMAATPARQSGVGSEAYRSAKRECCGEYFDGSAEHGAHSHAQSSTTRDP